MIDKLTLQDAIDRIDQIRERSASLFGYRLVRDAELAEAVAHLRTAYPEQVRNACAVLEQRDALLTDARRQGNRLIEEAQHVHDDLVAESDIVKGAAAQRERMIEEAAQARRLTEQQADEYSLKMLQQLEQILERLTETVKDSASQFQREGRPHEAGDQETQP